MKGKIVLSSEEQLHIIQSGAAGLTPLEAMKKKLDRGTPLNIKLGVDPTSPMRYPCASCVSSRTWAMRSPSSSAMARR